MALSAPCFTAVAPTRYLNKVESAMDSLKRQVNEAPITMLSHSVRTGWLSGSESAQELLGHSLPEEFDMEYKVTTALM